VSKPIPDRPDPEPAASQSSLSLEDTVAQNLRGVTPRIKSGVSGYNPYDAAPTHAPAGDLRKPPTDLRKLSEWIRLTRQVAALKKDKPE
jgi:hypothetical protein